MSEPQVDAGDGRLDCIEIADMEFAGFLGTSESERAYPQPLFFDLKLYLDLSRAGRTDKIRDTVNYHRVQKLIADCVYESRHRLLESYATDVLDLLFENFPKVQAIGIRIKKPHALRNTEYTAVELQRDRAASKPIRGFTT